MVRKGVKPCGVEVLCVPLHFLPFLILTLVYTFNIISYVFLH